MKTVIATTFAAAMLAASSMAFAEDMNNNTTNNSGTMTDDQSTGSIVAPDGTEDLRTFCNTTPDDAKCRANNMGEINKGN